MAEHLYGIHDWSADWASLVRHAGKTAWTVITEEIGDDPGDKSGVDYRHTASHHVTPIVRLNYSHHGQGTIPLPDRYQEFAQRCANFVAASQGCTHWIIGNEPNLAGERPAGIYITPEQYARCYNFCRAAIKAVDNRHQVIVGAIAPYNVDSGLWITYWREVLGWIGDADGLAVHTYSRGEAVESIWSEDKMQGEPYNKYYNGFRAYRDFLAEVPPSMRHLPVYITETDQNEPWRNENSGWVRAAYTEIDEWNQMQGTQKIVCLALYRWQKHDQWSIKDKIGVIIDFRDTLQRTNLKVPDLFLPSVKNETAKPSVLVVVPDGANIRVGPGTSYTILGAVPYHTKLPITGKSGDSSWWQVESEFGKGWVSDSVVETSNTENVPVVLVQIPLPVEDRPVQTPSKGSNIDVLEALLQVESGGRGFGPDGKLLIRFEAHIFVSRGGNPEFFTFNKEILWQDQQWRRAVNEPWRPIHTGNQADEYAALEFAASLNRKAAYESISMGAAQIMGFHYAKLGYSSAEEMFRTMQRSLNAQIISFIFFVQANRTLVEAINRKDWNEIAKQYNGGGNVEVAATKYRNAYEQILKNST